jgi:hypothetical protein
MGTTLAPTRPLRPPSPSWLKPFQHTSPSRSDRRRKRAASAIGVVSRHRAIPDAAPSTLPAPHRFFVIGRIAALPPKRPRPRSPTCPRPAQRCDAAPRRAARKPREARRPASTFRESGTAPAAQRRWLARDQRKIRGRSKFWDRCRNLEPPGQAMGAFTTADLQAVYDWCALNRAALVDYIGTVRLAPPRSTSAGAVCDAGRRWAAS